MSASSGRVRVRKPDQAEQPQRQADDGQLGGEQRRQPFKRAAAISARAERRAEALPADVLDEAGQGQAVELERLGQGRRESGSRARAARGAG